MKRSLFALALLGTATLLAQTPATPARMILVLVVDGLRPDTINASVTPTIAALRDAGVEYVNGHSVFPTVTRVNTASLVTGAYPE